eukprot:CAMPEP_0197026104 /NCGR_PEP_ID=MMETSP1384-20130603/6266_1 /TAXON_ID=29189 /ORGANISM="Ammonia sp." /LENGTH=818 /DNA_ID=CAMNT_0042454715 /DNA_START=5 /DNA_END=2461 /DNA_ORIENTATION=+
MSSLCTHGLFSHSLLTIILFLFTQIKSQCLVVYVDITNIDASLDATDWEGTYTYAGTQASCPRYTTADGKTLSYDSTAWSIMSTSNPPDLLIYEQTPAQLPAPCDPPLGVDVAWQHGTAPGTTITITCSYSSSPTVEPTAFPSIPPTQNPSKSPSETPTDAPSKTPTLSPTTSEPTTSPSDAPSETPTDVPSTEPTVEPTGEPSESPTPQPSASPVPATTREPTMDCRRIEVSMRAPIDVVISYTDGVPIDGVYYQHPLPKLNGYPWYQQQGDNSYGQIFFSGGHWRLVDTVNGINLEAMDALDSTEYVPPHSTIPVPRSWSDLNGVDTEYPLWSLLIYCGSITDSPTTDPTTEPTLTPTEYPTAEPTTEPTTEAPSSSPTLEPTLDPTWTTTVEEPVESTFLEVFEVIEWVLIVVVLVACCLAICILCIWRNRQLEQAKTERQQHNLSVHVSDDDELELVNAQKKRNQASLDFAEGGTKLSVAEEDGMSAKRVSSNYNKNTEKDFANALAVVSSHKSQNSLYANQGINNKEEDDDDAFKQGNKKQSRVQVDVASMSSNDDDAQDIAIKYSPDTPMAAAAVSGAGKKSVVDTQESDYGGHSMQDIYSCTFLTKPFGMEWKTTKQDKKNLYVSKIQDGSQASIGGVTVGSRLLSFNGEMIENLGAKKIYAKLTNVGMPVTITFLKPPKSEEEQEGDSNAPPPMMSADEAMANAKKPPLAKLPSSPPAPVSHSPNVSDIPPAALPPTREFTNEYNAGSNSDNEVLIPPKVPPLPSTPDLETDDNDALEQAQKAITEVFEDDDDQGVLDEMITAKGSTHAD